MPKKPGLVSALDWCKLLIGAAAFSFVFSLLLQAMSMIVNAGVATISPAAALQSEQVGGIGGVATLIKDVGTPIVFLAVGVLAIYIFAKKAGPAFQTFTANIQEQSQKSWTQMVDLYRERLEASEHRASELEARSTAAQEKYLQAQQDQGTRHESMLQSVLAATKAGMEAQTAKHAEEMKEVVKPINELVGQVKAHSDVLRDLSREIQRNTKP